MDKGAPPVSVSVSSGTVIALTRLPGGINPIIDKLRSDHRLDVNYDGNTLELLGTDADILTLAEDLLDREVGKKVQVGTRSLGGNGSVVWTFDQHFNIKVDGLFESELNEIKNIKTVKHLPDESSGQFKLSCQYAVYDAVNQKMNGLEQKVNQCKTEQQSISKTADVRMAEEFIKTKKCCCQIVEENKKKKLYFYGKDIQSCKKTVESWEAHKKGSHHTTSPQASNNTTNKVVGKVEPKTVQANQDQSQKKSPNAVSMDYQTPLGGSKTAAPVMSKPQMKTFPEQNTGLTKTYKQDKNEDNQTAKLNASSIATACDSTSTSWQSSANKAGAAKSMLKRELGKTTGSGEKIKYSFEIDDIKYYVYKESILAIKGVDAITNAANEKLMHAGGVALIISKAAGKKMDQNCQEHVEKNGKIPVTQNFISKPGDLKCKGIVHAVGPSWYDYKDKRDECAKDLYLTVRNVLEGVRNNGWRSVALTAISSGIFGVPKKLCAEMYIKAFAEFAEDDHGTLEEVHFIDVSREILDLVVEAHKTWVAAPEQLAFQNAFNYLPAKSEKTVRSSSGATIKFLGQGMTSYGERMYKYSIGDRLKLFVYNGSLTRLEIDAIGFPIGKHGSQITGGLLAQSVERFAGKRYMSSLQKQMHDKHRPVLVSTETGRLGCQQIVHVLAPKILDMSEKSLQVIAEMYSTALTYDYSKQLRLAMPLTGTGLCRSPHDIERLCQCVIATVVGTCLDRVKLKVSEFHIVNTDSSATTYIQNELRAQTTSSFNKSSGLSASTWQGKSTGAGGHARNDVDIDGWIRHKPLPDMATKYGETPLSDKTKKQGKTTEIVDSTKSIIIKEAPKNCKCAYCIKRTATKLLPCGHGFCTACMVPVESKGVCLKCSHSEVNGKTTVSSSSPMCPICRENVAEQKELPCKHELCRPCYEILKEKKPECPICKHIFGEIRGNQPPGDMYYRFINWRRLPGYEKDGVIQIYYDIPDGVQQEDHPNPGARFTGTQRNAFLPDNAIGKEVLELLRLAFDRRLIFTVGASRTTGKEGMVTWNDIHHKTRPEGGPERFGYPDPGYLDRVKDELADKGVTSR